MTVREIMVGYPGTKDIRLHPYYRGRLSRWAWRFYHHRLTRSGRWFLGASALIALVLSAIWSLDTQTYLLLLYTLGLWIVSLPAFVFVPRVSVAARYPERITSGETLQIEADVTNTGKLPLVDLALHAWGLPLQLDADPEEGVPLGTLRPGECVRARLRLCCPKRGAYTLGGFRVDTDFPFGLACAFRVVKQPGRLLVHPNFAPLSSLQLPSGRRSQPGGIVLAAQSADSFEYVGSREWREGDRLRDIDWRATARQAGTPGAPLIVREWREEHFLRVGVVLDTLIPATLDRNRRGLREDALERAVSLCAAVSDLLSRRGYVVDLFAAGGDVWRLASGRGGGYREQILDILACIEATSVDPFADIEARLAGDLGRLTTVICLLIDNDEPRRDFVENLRAQGVGVKVIYLTDSANSGGSDNRDEIWIDTDAFAHGVETL